ncbi:amino acid ABC transporter permease [Enterococcus timonensis]|uniref:amino acid ABC transporter permease n=1 Tax=Enterococcus timonensis TaxID=1852364 RepID=UPI0008D92D64|nr:amino acid ABC transporter permease [Enterococcus timonensis]
MQYLLDILPALLTGVLTTLKLFGLTLVLSIPLGLLVSFPLQSKFKPLKWIFDLYVLLMRGTPLLLQLIFVFYGLPLLHVVFDRFPAALLAFTLNYAAYFAEIFRGGFNTIPKGQFEASRMLKLSKGQTLKKIILPQVTKNVVPPMGNEIINLIKDSSLVYVLGLSDLLKAGQIAMQRDVTLVPLLAVGVVYIVLILLITALLKKIEAGFNYYQ